MDEGGINLSVSSIKCIKCKMFIIKSAAYNIFFLEFYHVSVFKLYWRY